MVANTLIEIDGVVERVMHSGFRLAGHDDWLNVSKFATPRPQLPREGERVCATLDKAGFVRSVAVFAEPAAQQPAGRAEKPENRPLDAQPSQTAPPTKDQRITRMNALTNAVALSASGGRVASIADVLAAAAQLEAWVAR